MFESDIQKTTKESYAAYNTMLDSWFVVLTDMPTTRCDICEKGTFKPGTILYLPTDGTSAYDHVESEPDFYANEILLPGVTDKIGASIYTNSEYRYRIKAKAIERHCCSSKDCETLRNLCDEANTRLKHAIKRLDIKTYTVLGIGAVLILIIMAICIVKFAPEMATSAPEYETVFGKVYQKATPKEDYELAALMITLAAVSVHAVICGLFQYIAEAKIKKQVRNEFTDNAQAAIAQILHTHAAKR